MNTAASSTCDNPNLALGLSYNKPAFVNGSELSESLLKQNYGIINLFPKERKVYLGTNNEGKATYGESTYTYSATSGVREDNDFNSLLTFLSNSGDPVLQSSTIKKIQSYLDENIEILAKGNKVVTIQSTGEGYNLFIFSKH